MYYIGAHVSAAGGAHNAVTNAVAIGANAFALFTKNQRQWNAPPLEEDEIALFKAAMADANYSAHQVLPHNSYLINLANPDSQKRRQSIESFIGEMRRVEQLGLDRLNFHPGAHLNASSVEEASVLIAEAIDEILAQVDNVYAVLETTAGQGSALGRTFEELARIIELTKAKDRVGVCLDTCHIFAAGYDLRSAELYEQTMGEFERLIGFDRLMGAHLNDAKSDFGSHVDRHAPLGQGNLGLEPFKLLMKDSRFKNVPLILETNDPDLWAQEISMLRDFSTAP